MRLAVVRAGLQLTVIGALLSRPETRRYSRRDQPAPKPMDPGFCRDRLESAPAWLLNAPMVGGLRPFGLQKCPITPRKRLKDESRRLFKALISNAEAKLICDKAGSPDRRVVPLAKRRWLVGCP